ncbi:MAG: hypothetical protein LW720_10700 [Pirellula sp.]|jgi:hypothetical protein|nr:hypothetical protein [Pirellula sp.]
MPEVAQVRRLAFNDEEIGMGFNSKTGLAVGSPLKGFSWDENSAATGAEVVSAISIVSTYEELQETLGMSFEAQGRYGIVSGSAKAAFSEKTNYNSMSTFVVASVVVRNPLRRGKNFEVTDVAKALLASNNMDQFERAFGDSFVRGLQTGGEFYAVVRITSVSTSTQASLAAALQAEYNGFGGFSFQAEFEKTKKSASTKSEFTTVMYQRAGSGLEISPTVTIDEVIDRFKRFPEIAKSNASAYEVEIATYDTIPLPVPTPVEQEAFLETLADAREKKLRYIQTRNDLEFAIRFPEFFESLPPVEILTATTAGYTKLMNAVTQHAIKLSKGQISPPAFFDPGLLSPPLAEPAPIPLRKKNLQGQAELFNTMPNLVGQLAQPVVNFMACMQLENVDHCLNFMGSELDALGLDRRDLGNFFFTIFRSGVKFETTGNFSIGSRIRSQFPAPGETVPPLSVIRLESMP